MKAFTVLFLIFLHPILAQNSDWQYRNPYPQNNFYKIKFFNQNTGLIAGEGGYILKTTNGGASFQFLSTNTSAIIYDMHFLSQQIFFAIGENSTIIYTSNGGNSWLNLFQVSNSPALKSIKFLDPLTGFAVGNNGRMLRTTNGGFNWSILTQITQLNLNTIFFQDAITGWIAADSGKAFKTTNAGNSWIMQTVGSVNLYGIAFINSLTGYITTRFSGGFKTTDGGNTWNNAQVGYSGEENKIKFADANTGYVYGKNGPISRTTNGGLNWNTWCSSQLFSGNIYHDISPVDSNTVYVCGGKGWILKCYGLNQSAMHIGGSKSPLSRISFTSAATGAMMGDGSLLFTTTNGGDKWNITLCGTNSWFEGSSLLTDLWIYSPTSWYRKIYWPGVGGFSSTSVQHSTDGGISWAGNRYYSTYSSGVANLDVFETGGVTYLTGNSQIQKNSGAGWSIIYNGSSPGNIYFADASTGFVALNSTGLKGILYTSNGGANWTSYPTGSTKYIESVFLMQSGLGFVGCDSSLLRRTTNFGVNWSQIPVPNYFHVRNIRFANENTGWFLGVSRTIPETGRLFVTTGGGASFQQMLSLGNFDVKGFSFADSQNGYVCGDSGVVLKTTNGGLTFVSQTGVLFPDNYGLLQNYPNPFNPATNIKFDIPKSGFVKIVIYDLLGREITQLVNQQMQPGSYSVDWDASNNPSGVYFYSIETGNFKETRKMVLVK